MLPVEGIRLAILDNASTIFSLNSDNTDSVITGSGLFSTIIVSGIWQKIESMVVSFA